MEPKVANEKLPSSVFAGAPTITAVVLSTFSVVPHLFLSRETSLGFAAVLLGVIAGVYFGFAVVSGSFREQLIELSLASGFGLAALLGLTFNPWLLPTAYLGHSFWDLAHHNKAKLQLVAVPEWYVPWCAMIDLLTAVGLVTVWRITGVL